MVSKARSEQLLACFCPIIRKAKVKYANVQASRGNHNPTAQQGRSSTSDKLCGEGVCHANNFLFTQRLIAVDLAEGDDPVHPL